MSDSEPGIDTLIQQARTDGAALGVLFERYRPFLLLIAQSQIDPRLAIRLDPSDIVQQTFVEALQAFPAFSGTTEPEFTAWIVRILERNLADAVRQHVHAEFRSIKRERMRNLLEGSASVVWFEAAVDSSTPSRRAIRAEQALRMAALLQSLPAKQRDAVRLRHLENRSIKEVAQHLECSLPAAAGLIKRGVRALREKMSAESW